MRLTRQAALVIALASGLLAAGLAYMWIGVGNKAKTPTTDVVTIGGQKIITETGEGQTYDVVWLDPEGKVETFTGVSKWCEVGGLCHGGSLHFVDPRTNQWIEISGTYRCTRIDRVEK